METWEVVGVDTKGKMTIKNENRTYDGVYLYLVGDAPDQTGRYRGRICREQFISNERLGALGVNPLPGDTIRIHFNRFGSICQIEVV